MDTSKKMGGALGAKRGSTKREEGVAKSARHALDEQNIRLLREAIIAIGAKAAKRLLKRVKLMMEDSLRELTIGSLDAFTAFVETCVEGEIRVKTTSNSETVFTDPTKPAPETEKEKLRISRKLALTKPPPLFVVDLVLSEQLVVMNQDEVDARDYRPTKQAKLWSENTGQHYPGFADEPSNQPKPKQVTIPKVKRDVVVGPRGERKTMSDEKYKAELDAQRKRAQALAYLEQGDDGVPDACLRGRAAEKRKREKMSQLERTRDNTLKQVAGRERDEAYKEQQHKLLGVQAQLRNAGSLVRQEAPAVMVPSAAPTAAVALPP